jgi:hypothetical protein
MTDLILRATVSSPNMSMMPQVEESNMKEVLNLVASENWQDDLEGTVGLPVLAPIKREKDKTRIIIIITQ